MSSLTDHFERVFPLGLGERAGRLFWELTGAETLPSAWVEKSQVRAAERYVERAAMTLGVGPPYVRWFQSRGGRETSGYFIPQMPKAVWFNVDLSPGELEHVVYHEVKHAADFERGDALTEPAADGFARTLKGRCDWHCVERRPHRHIQEA